MCTESLVKRTKGSLWTGLIVLTCLRVWLGPVEWTPRAQAQLPDSAKQRVDQIAELRRSNELLGEIVRILRTEQIKVVVEGSDKKPAGTSTSTSGRTTRVPGRR